MPGPTTPAAERSRLRHDIQALRAGAAMAVVLYHLFPAQLPGGYIGVDAFFVISGYLIAGQIISEQERGTFTLRQFWLKRARRLLPASFVVLAVVVIATWLFVDRALWSQYFREVIASTVYVENWRLAADSVDYLAASNLPSPVQHFWTLSVEEQFYLVTPIALVLAARTGLTRRGVTIGLAVLTIAGSGYAVYATRTNPSGAYFSTFARAWEFLVGATIASSRWTVPKRIRPGAFWLGSGALALGVLTFDASVAFPGYAAWLPVGGTALVIASSDPRGAVRYVTHVRPVRALGDMSYALYLWHWPFIVLAGGVTALSLLDRLGILALTVALAWWSTHRIERPIRAASGGVTAWRAAVGGITAATLVLVSASWLGLDTIRRSEATIAEQVADAQSLLRDCFGAGALFAPGCPAPTTIVPDVQVVATDDANRSECWSTKEDTQLHVCPLGPPTGYSKRLLAIGDSHNNSMISTYESVAHILNWRIDVTGRRGCHWTDAYPDEGPGFGEACAQWRANVALYLAEREPYDAILAMHAEGFPIRTDGDQKQAEIDGLVSAWTPQAMRGVIVIGLQDAPSIPRGTTSCLQTHGLDARQRCARPADEAYARIDSPSEAARRVPGAVFVETRPLFCNDLCSPEVGGVAVLQDDAGHVTETYARSMGPYLAIRLAAILEPDRPLSETPPPTPSTSS